VNLQDNDFQLFGLAPRFAQDRAAIDARWKDMQKQAHPDKFAAHDAAAQRLAMQWSVRINEAYQRLKDPLRRAAYLCELQGFPIQAENNTAMPVDFLMQQMQWRESLDEAGTVADLDVIDDMVNAVRRTMLQNCEQLLDVAKDMPAATQQVRALMFIERFVKDVEAQRDRIESADKRQ
jgi:molecular chaperone HscB